MAKALRRFVARANALLSPTVSAVLVIGFVSWVLVQPFLHLTGLLATLLDIATTVTVLVAVVLIEVGRKSYRGGGQPADPRDSGRLGVR